MTQIEKYRKSIQVINNNLTLKDNYEEEINQISTIESDLSVLAYMNAPRWQINDLRSELKSIKNWIKEEVASKLS